MSASSQNGRPVILWISMRPGTSDLGHHPADAEPTCNPSPRDMPTGPTARPHRRPGVFIPYSVLRVLSVLVVGGVAGVLTTLEWPQVSAMLGTICAIIGTGLGILGIMRGAGRE